VPIHEKKVRADLHSIHIQGRMNGPANLRFSFYPNHSDLSTRPSKSSLFQQTGRSCQYLGPLYTQAGLCTTTRVLQCMELSWNCDL
jgi:hypothetical protein